MKRALTVLLVCLTTALAQAQSSDGYVHYTPIPVAPLPPVQPLPTPQYPVMPPPAYYQSQPAKHEINKSAECVIQTAKINGNDLSQHYVNAKAFVAFYTIDSDPTPLMAVVIPGENTNSHGKLNPMSSDETPQTSTSYGRTRSVYTWNFVNVPAGTKGVATVTFIKEYRKDGTAFTCTINASDGNIEFSGLLVQ